MDIEKAIESMAVVENAGSPNFLTFPYMSALTDPAEKLSVSVPIHGGTASKSDKTALAEAVKLQGALGVWELKQDGAAWLIPNDR